ncbi:MAG: D-amino-acid transaminase [Alphaproteobacteria bacterium]
MSRISYVNGRYLPHRQARVHIEDRGYQFADGVYEVIAIRHGRPIDYARHIDRLERSLDAIHLNWPVTPSVLAQVIRRVCHRNRVMDGIVYVQITRGQARRDHAFPARPVPSLVVTARSGRLPPAALLETGIDVITVPDLRWTRCDIKSIALLPNVLGKQAARDAGAFEAWQIDADGFITEGTSTNAWIIDASGRIRTRSLDRSILAGITRDVVFEVAAREGLAIAQEKFTLDEALSAREAFLTSTTSFVLPVVKIDGKPVGGGRPGPVSRRLAAAYAATIDAQMAGRAEAAT